LLLHRNLYMDLPGFGPGSHGRNITPCGEDTRSHPYLHV